MPRRWPSWPSRWARSTPSPCMPPSAPPASRYRTSPWLPGSSWAPSPTPSCRWWPTSAPSGRRWLGTTSSPRSRATPTRCAGCASRLPSPRPTSTATRTGSGRPRRRLLPAGRHRRGPGRGAPRHQGPTGHRQVADDRQPRRGAGRRGQACPRSSRRSGPPSTRSSVASPGSGSVVSSSTSTTAPRRGGGSRTTSSTVSMRRWPTPRTSGGAAAATVRTARELLAAHLAAMHEVREPWGVSALPGAGGDQCLALPGPTRRDAGCGSGGAQLGPAHPGPRRPSSVRLVEAAALGAWTRTAPTTRGTERGSPPPTRPRSPGTSPPGWPAGPRPAPADVRRGVRRHRRCPPRRALRGWGRPSPPSRRSATPSRSSGRRSSMSPSASSSRRRPAGGAARSRAPTTAGGSAAASSGRPIGCCARDRHRRDLHQALVDASEQRTTWREMAGAGGTPELPVDLDRAQSAYAEVVADIAWLDARLAAREAARPSSTPTSTPFAARLGELDAQPDRLAVVPTVIDTLDAMGRPAWGPSSRISRRGGWARPTWPRRSTSSGGPRSSRTSCRPTRGSGRRTATTSGRLWPSMPSLTRTCRRTTRPASSRPSTTTSVGSCATTRVSTGWCAPRPSSPAVTSPCGSWCPRPAASSRRCAPAGR